MEGWDVVPRCQDHFLNAVISALSLYYMSFFILPQWVRERIDRIRKRFLWGGSEESDRKYHLVS